MGREVIHVYHKHDDYLSEFNAEFYHLEQRFSGGDIGIQQFCVLEKTSESLVAFVISKPSVSDPFFSTDRDHQNGRTELRNCANSGA